MSTSASSIPISHPEDIANRLLALLEAGEFPTPNIHQILKARVLLFARGGSMPKVLIDINEHIASHPVLSEHNRETLEDLVQQYAYKECGPGLGLEQLGQLRYFLPRPDWTVIANPRLNHWDPTVRIPSRTTSGLNSVAAFGKFSAFPKEIQDQVWSHALDDETNTIILEWRFKQSCDAQHVVENRFVNVNGPPKLLQVNQDSRDLALRRYTKAFGTWMSEPMTYVDFRKDVVFIKTRNQDQLLDMVPYLVRSEMRQVRFLALPYRDVVKHDPTYWGAIARSLARFRGVKQVQFVCGDSPVDIQYGFATLGSPRNYRMWEKVERYFEKKWKEARKDKDIPLISMKVVDARRAAEWGIDGITY